MTTFYVSDFCPFYYRAMIIPTTMITATSVIERATTTCLGNCGYYRQVETCAVPSRLTCYSTIQRYDCSQSRKRSYFRPRPSSSPRWWWWVRRSTDQPLKNCQTNPLSKLSQNLISKERKKGWPTFDKFGNVAALQQRNKFIKEDSRFSWTHSFPKIGF